MKQTHTETTIHLSDAAEPSVEVLPITFGQLWRFRLRCGPTELAVVGTRDQVQSLVGLTPERAKRYARVILGSDVSETAIQLAATLLMNDENREAA